MAKDKLPLYSTAEVARMQAQIRNYEGMIAEERRKPRGQQNDRAIQGWENEIAGLMRLLKGAD